MTNCKYTVYTKVEQISIDGVLTMVSTEQKIASFRINAEKWSAFMEYAREHNTTATSLILNYIDNCLNAESNGVLTNDSRTDNNKNYHNSIECLKDVQDSLIEESQKQDKNIDRLFELVKELAQENKALKSQLDQLEKTVNDDVKAYQDRQEVADDTITENVKKLEQLESEVKTTRTQLNECRIETMTREDLRALLRRNNIKSSDKARKTALIELVLEHGLIVI